jgi:RNA polymerase sigma factor (sigma-70 family)
MQESYLKVWERLDKISNIEQALPLVKTYTRNLLIDVIRRRMKEDQQWLETLKEEVADLVEEPSSLENKHQLEILDIAIDRLPEKCKTVYLYHREEGLSYAEIAAQLSVSVSMVEKHMSKAIRLLKKELLTDPSLLLLVVLAGGTYL